MVKPCLLRSVEERQERSKFYRDGRHPVPRKFDLYQNVRVRNVRGGVQKWIAGVVVKIKGPSTYLVRVPGNSRRFVHADHLIADDTGAGAEQFPALDQQSPDELSVDVENGPEVHRDFVDPVKEASLPESIQTQILPPVTKTTLNSELPVILDTGPHGNKALDVSRRSVRSIKPPDRYGH
jgi:hypothetical protein